MIRTKLHVSHYFDRVKNTKKVGKYYRYGCLYTIIHHKCGLAVDFNSNCLNTPDNKLYCLRAS